MIHLTNHSLGVLWHNMESPIPPNFEHPGKIDILLGVDIFVETQLHGQQIGSPSSPLKQNLVGFSLVTLTPVHMHNHHIASH